MSIPIHTVTIVLLLMQGRSSHTIIGKWEAVEPADGSHWQVIHRVGL